MEFNSAAAPPSAPPQHPCSNNPAAGVRRRLIPTVKLANRLRRSDERLAAQASGGGQIPPPPPPRREAAAAKRPPSLPRRPPSSSRIQSRGANRRRPSPAAYYPYYWGATGRRSAPGGGGGGCSSNNRPPALPPQILLQSRGEKRKYSPFPFFFAWGAKRARCAPPDLVRGVDWANLGDGPAGLIAELALANDVADYIRFRAVCRPWRRCSPDPPAGLDGRFLPRRWIMLDKALSGPRRRRFLNVSTGECIRMDLPELDDEHILLALTPAEGLLLLLHQPTHVVRLLNPLTRQLTDLPSVTPLLPPHLKNSIDLEVYGVGVTEDSTVGVYFQSPRVLAIAKPGDKHWSVVCREYLDSALLFAGRFYCCFGRRLMVLDTTSSSSCSNQQQQPRLVVAAEGGNSFRFYRMTDRLHLVDNAGELMLVHRLLYQDPPGSDSKRTHKAYRVDLDAGALVPVEAFGRRAIFIGQTRTISVTPEAFPSVAGDKLYFGFDCEETDAEDQCDDLYELEDGGSGEPHYDSSVAVRPCSVINCLAHCIQGSGGHLA